MSITQLLHTAKSSLLAYRAAMNTVGQNVANAESEGYSRRMTTLSAQNVAPQGRITRGTINTFSGTGVKVESYERMRDELLDRTAWHSNGFMGASEEEHRVVAALESIFAVQTEGSLTNQLDRFFNAWSDLADNPTDNGVRLALRSRGAALAGTLNRMSADVNHLEAESKRALAGHVDDANKMFAEIAELNAKVTRGRYLGKPDHVAEDRRGLLVNKLSEMGTFRVHEQENGSFSVTLDGMNLVSEQRAQTLSIDNSGVTPEIKIAGTNVSMGVPPEGGGKLAGLLRGLQTTLPDTLARLDSIAETIVKEVNAIHTTGFDLDGNTNVDFFHYAAGPPEEGIKATSITLSNAVKANSRAIVASQGDPSLGVNDSGVANDILALRENTVMNGNTETVETFVINMVSGIGAVAERAGNLYESHAAFSNHVQAMAEGVSGVSLEEEMTSLIEFQQAFSASARVITAAEEMMDTLLAL
ncbi:MAG: flagellar hook-associated protein FlgK [Rhodothermales bacterium]